MLFLYPKLDWRTSLNESPSEKEGKFHGGGIRAYRCIWRLNESPSEKEGKFLACIAHLHMFIASMKVPPKRKGNRP